MNKGGHPLPSTMYLELLLGIFKRALCPSALLLPGDSLKKIYIFIGNL
jgi:hypothetical protein